jgi:hypothetical protein
MGMHRQSQLGFAVALAAVVTLALAGWSSSTSKSSAKPKTAPSTSPPTTSAPVVGTKAIKIIPGSATGTSACEKAAPTPSSPGQVGGGEGGSQSDASKAEVAATEHGERGMVQQQTLTKGEREALEGQMTLAREVAVKYPTVKDALAAGYMKSTPFVPCIGAHYTNVSLAASFNPSTPSELLYDGTNPDSKIVGLSYLVWHPGGTPPPGFAGNNDHWHQHNANGGLCLRGGVVIGDEGTTRQDCDDRGGRKS